MRINLRKKKNLTDEQLEIISTKDFFDRTVPGIIKFYTDHYICGNFYKSCWAVTEYPTSTEETAILAHLADRNGVTLRIYNRLVTSMEQRKIVQQAMRKNHMMTTTNDVNESIKAQDNINDVVELLSELRRNKEPLLHTAVFIELKASSEDKLKELQADISMELTRSKISVDRLLLRQKEGFLSVLPTGNNVFASQFERVLPASSVANLYPLNYSGKTDENGFYIGRDKYGSNVLVDFDKRTEDKTNSNILILGNSGQGKSHFFIFALHSAQPFAALVSGPGNSGLPLAALDDGDFEMRTRNRHHPQTKRPPSKIALGERSGIVFGFARRLRTECHALRSQAGAAKG